jgi:hypothetical protein
VRDASRATIEGMQVATLALIGLFFVLWFVSEAAPTASEPHLEGGRLVIAPPRTAYLWQIVGPVAGLVLCGLVFAFTLPEALVTVPMFGGLFFATRLLPEALGLWLGRVVIDPVHDRITRGPFTLGSTRAVQAVLVTRNPRRPLVLRLHNPSGRVRRATLFRIAPTRARDLGQVIADFLQVPLQTEG